MPARAYWKGQIRLALVSIPIKVYPVTRSGAAISFHQIHEPGGKRIRYEKVAPGVGPVDGDEIIKGFEVAKGNYVLLEEEEIAAVKIESRKALELVEFVDADEIDVLYNQKPYFVVPADDLAEEAYTGLREALRRTRKVGLGQLAVRGREQLVSTKPCGRALVMEVLRYADEVHKAPGYFRDVEDARPGADLLDLATIRIEEKTAPFKPAEFHDRYVDALHRRTDKKARSKGNKRILEDPEESSSGKGSVIDLMAALKKSVGESWTKAAKLSSSLKPAAKKPASSSRARKHA